ncbi:glycosyltransferase family 2 protein [Haloarcula sp. AONF1]
MADKPLVSYIIATYNRKESLKRTINSVLDQEYNNFEIIVVCNSNDSTPQLFNNREGEFSDVKSIRYFHSDERMGVIRARNFGYEQARGDILVTIDDDATFDSPDITSEIVQKFSSNTALGIIALKVVNTNNNVVEYPIKQSHLEEKVPLLKPQMKNEYNINGPELVPTFTGCGNAIDKRVFTAVGKYPPHFDYGSEELDLSLRAIDAGFEVKYFPSLVVNHYEDPSGRFTGRKILKENLKNRLAVSIRNHPLRYVILSALLWTGQSVIRSDGDLRVPIEAYGELFDEWRWLLESRDPISEETISTINAIGGRIY